MDKFLRCYKNEGIRLTKGKLYPVIDEGMNMAGIYVFLIKNDIGEYTLFSRDPDWNGRSYRDWFDLIDESNNQWIIKEEDINTKFLANKQ